MRATRALAAILLVALLAACSGGAGKHTLIKRFQVLHGRSTTLITSTQFSTALGAAHLTLGLVGAASIPARGEVRFPITGGSAAFYRQAPHLTGVIRHAGSGMSLVSASRTEVALTDLVLRPGSDRVDGDIAVNGRTIRRGVALFRTDSSSQTTPFLDRRAGTVSLSQTNLSLTAAGAGALAANLHTHRLRAGLLVGYTIVLAR